MVDFERYAAAMNDSLAVMAKAIAIAISKLEVSKP